MMQIPEFGVSGAEMYGPNPRILILPVPKFWTSGPRRGAEEIADLKSTVHPQIGHFLAQMSHPNPENCHFATPNFGLFGMRPLCGFFRVCGIMMLRVSHIVTQRFEP